jgi:heme exporter protein C
MMFVFIMILPRLTDSLHPGNGGNPAFGKYDLDSDMRLVFYPAVIGWVLLSLWILDVKKTISHFNP